MSQSTRPLRLLAVCAALSLVIGCGGGGSGSGGGQSTGLPLSGGAESEAGTQQATAAFSVTTGPGGGLIAGLNFPVTLQFNQDVDPATAGPASIQVVTILDPIGQATAPPGTLAGLLYEVSGNTVTLQPSVVFQPDQVIYGFEQDAFYEIAFADPTTGNALQSLTAETLNNSGTTFFFRTPFDGFDFNPGYPKVTAMIADDPTAAPVVVLPAEIVDGNGNGEIVDEAVALFSNVVLFADGAPPVLVPVTPTRDLIFIFDDAILPGTVVSPTDSSSPGIRVTVNTATLPTFKPKTMPAQYSVLHQQGNLTIVRWHCEFSAYPPGGFLFVDVLANIADLANNTKESMTGSTTPDLAASMVVAGAPVGLTEAFLEPFITNAKEDPNATSANWAAELPLGVLAPVLGGGTSEDGLFFIDPAGSDLDPRDTELPPEALISFADKIVSLPTVAVIDNGDRLPRTYQFSSLSLPLGWTLVPLTDRDGDGTPDAEEYIVSSSAHPLDGLGAPLAIKSSGDILLLGTIDVTGTAAGTLVRPVPGTPGYVGEGGDGGSALLATGPGGHGGDVLLLTSTDAVAFPLISPAATPSFVASDGTHVGATGRSDALTQYTLTDTDIDFSLLNTDPVLSAQLAAGEIRLQPNLGVGSSLLGNTGTANQKIDENHPTFVVESVAVDSGTGATTFTVKSGVDDPMLNQPSQNIGAQPIASSGDSFLIGRLNGRFGEDLTPFARGGAGAEPYLVVDDSLPGLITTGGGGAGGGGIAPGDGGLTDGPMSDPLTSQQGQGGVAEPDSAGATVDGTQRAPGSFGAIRAMGTIVGMVNGTEVDLVPNTQAKYSQPLSLLVGVGPVEPLAGSFLIPNSAVDGWMFEIESFDGLTFKVKRIQADIFDIGLTDPNGGPPGPDGPGLIPGSDYDILIVPRLDIGGGGGGGSGVQVTGTVKFNEKVLPVYMPGAAGGSGGGSLLIETATKLTLGNSSAVLAEGGRGGIVQDGVTGITSFSGGGGGAGGNCLVRVGQTFKVFNGALISVDGGEGGGDSNKGKGGRGGAGYIRLESFSDMLGPADLATVSVTPVDESNFGRFLGTPAGVGQSTFYESLFVNPEYDAITIEYLADTDGDTIQEALQWSFTDTGVGGGPDGFDDPPVRVLFNSVRSNDIGFIDSARLTDRFFEAADLVSGRAGLVYDDLSDVVLYSPGKDSTQLHRLDPVTLAPVLTGPPKIIFPAFPGTADPAIDIISMAVDTIASPPELFLFERVTSKVHVIGLTTGVYHRTLTLPLDVGGAMVYDPDNDLLVFADNRNNRFVTFAPRDDLALDPMTEDFAPLNFESTFTVVRDGTTLEFEIVGLAYDGTVPSNPRLWCTDSMRGQLYQISLEPGFEGTSMSGGGGERFSSLKNGADTVIPSAVAFDGASLALLHATDPTDSRLGAIDPADVSETEADLVLAGFGTLVPEPPRSYADADQFLRFLLIIDGGHDAGPVSFRNVRVDTLTVDYENKSF
jgi:hypothetical protein